MIFIETENLNLRVPSKENLDQWSEWINSPKIRGTISSTLIPKTKEMQWNWIENELNSKKRILLEICDKKNNLFLGVVSLSTINYENRSAQISTISPVKKNKENIHSVYEARRAILKYAFHELSINKVYAGTLYPDNKSYMIKNMCLGFEVEGIKHDSQWHNNQPKMSINYFITQSIFKKKKIMDTKIKDLLSKKNMNLNEKKLSKIVSFLQIK
jgi:RimJ/RimL family protein N-acetyltransferase